MAVDPDSRQLAEKLLGKGLFAYGDEDAVRIIGKKKRKKGARKRNRANSFFLIFFNFFF